LYRPPNFDDNRSSSSVIETSPFETEPKEEIMTRLFVLPSRAVRGSAALATLLLAMAAGAELRAQTVVDRVVDEEIGSQYQALRLVQVVEGLEQPWALAFLPDGGMLVTERPGRMQLVRDGRVTEVSGVPEVHAQNQGGLMDVVLHPGYQENGWIYFTYSRAGSDGTVPALVRARLDGDRLTDLEEVFESNEHTSPGRHYGSRILFPGDGTLFMSIGDRGAEPERAQDTRDHSGSLVRLNDDGSVPDDNPFVGNQAYAPEIFSYGHRNIQGIVRHPDTGEIWATEHGPRGGDELNLIEAGENYGWPVVSRGRDYRTQEQWGEGRRRGPMTDPVFEFLPTLAPSGLAVVDGGGFHSTWQGNLLAGGLASERIIRLVIENREVVHAEELLLEKIGRIRDVRRGPDGAIYIATGERDGGIFRLEPAG
jgi:aldose sugar dehydrogenase